MFAPLLTREVRWFLEGSLEEHAPVKDWFETVRPIPCTAHLGRPAWRERTGGEPDRYLLVPGNEDMGIKWREGQLQVKGRLADQGHLFFGERHEGIVECWVKWSWPGDPESCRALFRENDSERNTVAVHKVRAVRKIRFGEAAGEFAEVAEDEVFARGLGFELSEVSIGEKRWSSLAFEGFPEVPSSGEPSLAEDFAASVEMLLSEYPGEVLTVERSMSYPAFLRR
jgi:hypothetical protein